MASLNVDFSELASNVLVKSYVSMDVVLPEPSEGWPHKINGIAGASITSLLLQNVLVGEVGSINTIE